MKKKVFFVIAAVLFGLITVISAQSVKTSFVDRNYCEALSVVKNGDVFNFSATCGNKIIDLSGFQYQVINNSVLYVNVSGEIHKYFFYRNKIIRCIQNNCSPYFEINDKILFTQDNSDLVIGSSHYIKSRFYIDNLYMPEHVIYGVVSNKNNYFLNLESNPDNVSFKKINPYNYISRVNELNINVRPMQSHFLSFYKMVIPANKKVSFTTLAEVNGSGELRYSLFGSSGGSQLIYEDVNVSVYDVDNNVWWRRIVLNGDFSIGTTLRIAHNIDGENGLVHPVKILNKSYDLVETGDEWDNSDDDTNLTRFNNTHFDWVLESNYSNQTEFYVAMGKIVDWNNSGWQNITVNLSAIPLNATINISGFYGGLGALSVFDDTEDGVSSDGGPFSPAASNAYDEDLATYAGGGDVSDANIYIYYNKSTADDLSVNLFYDRLLNFEYTSKFRASVIGTSPAAMLTVDLYNYTSSSYSRIYCYCDNGGGGCTDSFCVDANAAVTTRSDTFQLTDFFSKTDTWNTRAHFDMVKLGSDLPLVYEDKYKYNLTQPPSDISLKVLSVLFNDTSGVYDLKTNTSNITGELSTGVNTLQFYQSNVDGGGLRIFFERQSDNILPEARSVNISSGNESSSDLNCSYTFFDGGGDNESNQWFKWYNQNGELNSTIQTLAYGNTSVGDNVTCSVRVNDGVYNSSWVNSSTIKIGDSIAPVLSSYSVQPSTINTDDTGFFQVVAVDNGSGVSKCVFNFSDPDSQVGVNQENNSVINGLFRRSWTFNKAGNWSFDSVQCFDGNDNSYLNGSVGLIKKVVTVANNGGGGGGGGGGVIIIESSPGILGDLIINPVNLKIKIVPDNVYFGEVKVTNTGLLDKEISIAPRFGDVIVTFINPLTDEETKEIPVLNIKGGELSNVIFIRYRINTDKLVVGENVTNTFLITDLSTSEAQELVFEVLIVESFWHKLFGEPKYLFDTSICVNLDCSSVVPVKLSWTALIFALIFLGGGLALIVLLFKR